ncbi:MAG TPA: hypothetical protein VKU87_02580 [Thermomicrobiaceae bacterium]|nr:hypothetical protein [Thermomicrobiaceae bacterium]
MSRIQLLLATGIAGVDLALTRTVETFEGEVPGCVLAYYLDGSLADGDSIATSDLDLTLVITSCVEGGDAGDHDKLNEIAARCQRDAGLELDIGLLDERELANGLTPMLKYASRLIHGEDIRDRYPLLAIEDWTRERMNAAYWLMNRVFDRPAAVHIPLGYPDPDDLFYGYARRPIRLSDGSFAASTRDLVRVSGWIATALVAHRASRYVSRKRDCHREYRYAIGDQWSNLLDDIYERCRTDWGYLIPAGSEDRRRLRTICRQMLGFENHFLTIYRDLLLQQLRERAPRALWLMERFPLADASISAAFRSARSRTTISRATEER